MDPDVDANERMVPKSPLAWEPLPDRPRRRWLAWLPILLLASFLAGAFRFSVPYYAIAPGDAHTVTPLIGVPDDRRHPPEGQVLLTTVSLGETKVIDALLGWLDPDVDIVEREQIVPPDTDSHQFRQRNFEFMESSKQTAAVVALRRLGYELPERGEGAAVMQVVQGSGAEGVLEVGDVITAVDGAPVTVSAEAVALIGARRPGDRIAMTVNPVDGGPARTVEAVLGENPDRPGAPLLGVVLTTWRQQFDLPFPVDISSAGIGGPSAGLAFTLGVLDLLTPGELTGGSKVAVTGTIQLDGSVGDVGGVAQKTAAVRAAGADVFLVPAGEYETALARAGDRLRIVKVSTLDDALAALAELGGNVSALGPPPGGQG